MCLYADFPPECVHRIVLAMVPFWEKKLKPDALNPEATHPTDSDHLEPLALQLPAGDFRTSLVLPGCVRFITSTLISIILPLPRAIAG